MRVTAVVIVAALAMASFGGDTLPRPTSQPASSDPFSFMHEYRIAHYLKAAAELQKLDPDKRVARLMELANDPPMA